MVRLTQEQEREVVMLLTELLMDAAARKRRASASPSAFGSVIDGASGSVVPSPERRGNALEVA